jgi:drug/metabolite transporter (DMT)-like permease
MARSRSRQLARARLAVLASTLIWGTSFTIVQRALADLPVYHLLAYRFLLATLVLLPLLARGRQGLGGVRPAVLLRDGLALGVLLFAGFSLQTYGLLWTTPSRSAFLIGLAVVMVPPIAWALHAAARRPPGTAGLPGEPATANQPAGQTSAHRLRPGPVAGAACAVIGLYVLYHPFGAVRGSAPAAFAAGAGWGLGDALTLGGTLCFACHIVGIERAVRLRGGALAPLAVVQFAVVALLAAPSLVIAPPRAAEATRFALFAVIFCGVASTAHAYLCQLYAQRHLAATETAVLLTFEPVVAALFSVAIGREGWTPALLLGGALILAAMLLSELGGGPGAVPPPIAAPSA